MTKWKVLRQRSEILAATILVYILCSAPALLNLLPPIQQLIVRHLDKPSASLLIYFLQEFGGLIERSTSYPVGDSAAAVILTVLGNMVGDLTLVYRLWIVMADSKYRGWIVIPVVTSILGAGTSPIIITQY